MLVALSLLAGCTTSMTYTTHPQTLEPGEWQGSVAMQGSANTNVITEYQESVNLAKERIKNANEQGSTLSEREYRQALDSALAFMLFKPAFATEFAARVGVVEGIDVGVRYNGASFKGDVKGRLWQSADERRVLSVMAGVGRQTIDLPFKLKYLTLTEFKRTDADLALMFGMEPFSFLRFYAGPRMIVSWVSAEPVIDPELLDVAPSEYADYAPVKYFQDETIVYGGATTGIMLGYEWIWVNLELTGMYMAFTPTVLEETRNLSGFQLAPVAGVMLEF
ncbi:hypothetical protein FIV42_13705 [Persicimonas caeni]|uniref:Outer membrane protein beta-barrel domain-containing protein n=1 Tax=Persicimonas caeni TaxID=2292766 RepID=A0A4Y6PTV7_PERCE|nr:hypothetical protein [Persicimonas caeni]QDG51764.1 hypothetical protein FIV42_13705 [Persicimonas caeni]QED32985.1 hypothetical protein FRD00_13700 [Persicimonas caeni]